MPNPYETASYLSEYLLFHYGKPEDLCDWPQAPKGVFDFHRRIVRDMVRRKGSRALDLGCAVGRLSFELSRHFDEVIGVDFSKSFVKAARRLAKIRSASFTVCEEGDITVRRTVRLDPKFRSRNVLFETGDAQRLRRDIGSFDLVVMANLICRLPNPKKCLQSISKLVKPGGQLVITTPCSWLEGYVPKKNRLARPGRTTLAALRKILSPHFKLTKRRDLPFLIREHRRKYQFIIAEASCWIRK
jgi:putative 4-mercaptohistidine N1-methyltranferase